jgi:hypothetical protein
MTLGLLHFSTQLPFLISPLGTYFDPPVISGPAAVVACAAFAVGNRVTACFNRGPRPYVGVVRKVHQDADGGMVYDIFYPEDKEFEVGLQARFVSGLTASQSTGTFYQFLAHPFSVVAVHAWLIGRLKYAPPVYAPAAAVAVAPASSVSESQRAAKKRPVSTGPATRRRVASDIGEENLSDSSDDSDYSNELAGAAPPKKRAT